MSKIPKLTDMFCKQQRESDTGIAEGAGAETTSHMETSVHSVPHPEPKTERKREMSADAVAVSTTSCTTNEHGEQEQGVHYCNEVGMSTEMCDWWIERGKGCQHTDADLKESAIRNQ